MTAMLKSFLLAASLFAALPALAGEHGTREEAVAMVRKAIAYIQAHGRAAAFAEFSKPRGAFTDRDLYITVYDLNGTNLAHGQNPRLVGRQMIDALDVDGRPWMRERLDLIKSKGKGWHDYRFFNPLSRQVEPKSTYVERFDDLIIGCGVYR